MRTSNNVVDHFGRVVDGYDYENQCWVVGGIIQRCGHPFEMDCGCYGKLHAGEKSAAVYKR